jgi:hypothetical protein
LVNIYFSDGLPHTAINLSMNLMYKHPLLTQADIAVTGSKVKQIACY